MVNAYDRDLRAIALEEARAFGLRVDSGVYVQVGGPSFDTQAEARMLRALGADAVGMSTVPEVIVARSLDMKVLGVSCVTNVLLDPNTAPDAAHSEVLTVASAASADLAVLIRRVLRRVNHEIHGKDERHEKGTGTGYTG
jgi:purine-nucleoside phosphorylase